MDPGSDITQIDTLAGPCWAAVVTDVFSRRIVGWSVAGHHRADLVTDALNMALAARRPAPGLILHSDQGAETGHVMDGAQALYATQDPPVDGLGR